MHNVYVAIVAIILIIIINTSPLMPCHVLRLVGQTIINLIIFYLYLYVYIHILKIMALLQSSDFDIYIAAWSAPVQETTYPAIV